MIDRPFNILLVEDNPGDARLVREMVSDCGDRVGKLEHAGRMDAALKLLAREQFDVVLLDINLPDSGGLLGLQRITAQNPEVAIVLLTVTDDEDLAIKAMQQRAGDYLVKGQINASLLMRSLRYAIERKQIEALLRRDKDSFEALVRERSQELLASRLELEKSKRLSDVGTLAATVAHELRNPLAAIAMAAYNIRKKARNPSLDSHIRNIEKKINESNQIINNLLFYSRLKTPAYETVDLNCILGECVGTARSLVSPRFPVRVELDLPEKMALEADPLQVREIFANILSNAFDAVSADPRGKIRISVSTEGPSVRVVVEDSGPGIDAETLPKIFEPFFTTKAKGTGLGLSVCEQMVGLHGGAITVDSGPAGTVVGVTLPAKRKK